MKNQATMIERMRKLVTSNETAKLIFQWAASRDKNSVATGLDRLCRKVKIEKDAAVKALGEFEKIGLGTYIIGRRGGKTRFEWNFGLVTVGMAAMGKSDAMEVLSSPGDDEETNEPQARTATAAAPGTATVPATTRQASMAEAGNRMGGALLLQLPSDISAAKLKQIRDLVNS